MAVKYIKIAGGLLIVGIVVFMSHSRTMELNLDLGKARLAEKVAGFTISETTNIHNPTLCPQWSNPTSKSANNTISFTCYSHLQSIIDCTKNVQRYNVLHEAGCNA